MSFSCPKCGSENNSGPECSQCGVIFSKLAPRRNVEIAPVVFDETAFDYDSVKIDLGAYPIAIVLVFLCKLLVLPDMIFWYLFTIPVHELGHSFMAWIGSRMAIPLGAIIPMAGLSFFQYDKSVLVFILFNGLLAAAVWFGLRARTYFLVCVSALLIVASVYVTSMVSAKSWEMAVVFCGGGGEFVISALLVISFYYPFPPKLRWDFFRFFALFIGMYVFISIFVVWRNIAVGIATMPMGSFLKGSTDAKGDVDRLMTNFGMKPVEIIVSYTRLGWLCFTAMVSHYVYFLWRAKQRADRR